MGNGKWVVSLENFGFALFCKGDTTAVAYKSASGQWGVESKKCGVGLKRGFRGGEGTRSTVRSLLKFMA